jgi:antitoxin YefM
MAIHISFADARKNLGTLWDHAEKDGERVVIDRSGHADMVLVTRAEWDSIEATDHLLRSPRNAARLLAAFRRSVGVGGAAFSPDSLRAEIGFGGDP